MKKSLSLLFAFIIVLSLTSCVKRDYSNYSEYEIIYIEDDQAQDSTSSKKTSKDKTSSKLNSSDIQTSELEKDIIIEPDKPVASKPQVSTGNGILNNQNNKNELPETNDVPDQEQVPEIEQEIVVQTTHTPVPSTQYYQYSSLSAKQKKVYNEILSAIKTTKNIINLSSFNITVDESYLILQKVLCDYPEFFYVSKYSSTVRNPITKNISALIIYYTDGITVDKIDNEFNLIAANRDNISNQIKQFNKKTEEILKKISANTTQIAKEKFIHNYLVLNTTYDQKAAGLSEVEFGQPISHDWDVYGALVEGSAVCEGYAKAFAYLCRNVGINATTITGTSYGAGHMWNAVLLDNEWYLVDVTWNDGDHDNDEINWLDYTYFNRTSKQFESSHSVETDLAYPSCTATENAFYNTYAINLTGNKISDNYKLILDEAEKYKEETLHVYIGNNPINSAKLLANIFNNDSPVQQYIKSKNYNMSIKMQYITSGNYVCFVIEH